MDIIPRLTRVYGDNVLIRKCGVGESLKGGGRGVNDENGKPLLYYPQYFADTTSFVEIIDIGLDCKWFTKEHCHLDETGGERTLCPEMGDGMVRVEEHFWFIPEPLLFPVLFSDAGLRAIGDCIVLEVPEKDRSSLIVTTDRMEDEHYVLKAISVGPGVKEKIPVGAKVLVPRRIRLFKVGGKKYGCVREEEVYGVEE